MWWFRIQIAEQAAVPEGFLQVLEVHHLIAGELPLPKALFHGTGLGGFLRLADALDTALHGECPLVELVGPHEGPEMELVSGLLELLDLGLLLL